MHRWHCSQAAPSLIRRFEEQSDTRVHCSPPSLAALHAAEHALAFNRTHGDRLRRYLVQLVRRFRTRLQALGLAAEGGPVSGADVEGGRHRGGDLRARLLHLGIRTIVIRRCRDLGARVAFLISALHRSSDIDMAVEAIGRAMRLDCSTRQLAARVS